MTLDKTVFQHGKIRGYRGDVLNDPDLDKLLLDLGDGLNPTELSGNRRSFRVADGTALTVLTVARGNGVNTIKADSGTLAGTENILGMVISVNPAGTEARIATNYSVVDGFVGLTKHAVYYLGAAGTIQLVPGVVPVEVGIAVSSTELLIRFCCCVCTGSMALEGRFSGELFECAGGAQYCLYGVAGEYYPALEFKPGVDNSWYTALATPPDMDTSQVAELEMRLVVPTTVSLVNTQWLMTYRNAAAAQNLQSGGLLTVLPVQAIAPSAQDLQVIFSYPIPANVFVHGSVMRQLLRRQGSLDSFAGSFNLIGATLKYAVR